MKRAFDATKQSLDLIVRLLEELIKNGEKRDYQALIRLQAIGKLLDPALFFYESDVERILNKGYSLPVQRGLKLYRMMQRLTHLCEPLGGEVGPAQRIRLIDFEKLSWHDFLKLKGQQYMLLVARAEKIQVGNKFDGLILLSSDEKELYQKAKKLFGARKRPTLKHVANQLLCGHGEAYSERSVWNYIAAVRELKTNPKYRFSFDWYIVKSVDAFSGSGKTIHENLEEMRVATAKLIADGMATLRQQVGDINMAIMKELDRQKLAP